MESNEVMGVASPACLLSVFITGFMQGELRDMWEWVDGGRQAPEVADEKTE